MAVSASACLRADGQPRRQRHTRIADEPVTVNDANHLSTLKLSTASTIAVRPWAGRDDASVMSLLSATLGR
jgi:hypothetical protein